MKTAIEWNAVIEDLSARKAAQMAERVRLDATYGDAALAAVTGGIDEKTANRARITRQALAEMDGSLADIEAGLTAARGQLAVAEQSEQRERNQARRSVLIGLMRDRQRVCADLVDAAEPFIAAIKKELAQRDECRVAGIPVPTWNTPAWAIAFCQSAKASGIVAPYMTLSGLDIHPDFADRRIDDYSSAFLAKAQTELAALGV